MADKKTLELQIKLIAKQAADQLKGFASEIEAFADKTDLSKEEIEKLSKKMNDFANHSSDSFKKAGSSLSDLKSNIKSLGEVVAAGAIDKAMLSLTKGALDASDSFQAAKDEFGIMLGDMQVGQGLFNELQKFNKWTPFEMEDTSQATKVLLSAKVELKDLTKYLTRFGDISQGNSQRFQSFIGAFSKASAKGKADMEVLNVYIDQGVQILDALGKQLGVSSEQVVKMASEGKISFEEFDRALADMAAEGGLYFNSMVTASQRLGAKQDSLQDSLKSLAASFGDLLAPAVKVVVDWIDALVNAINESPILKGLLLGALVSLVAVINGKMVVALISLIAKTWAAFASQQALNTSLSVTQPWLLAATIAVGAAAAGYVAYASAQQKAANATADMALEQEKLNEEMKKAADLPAEIQAKVEAARAKRAGQWSDAQEMQARKNELYSATDEAKLEQLRSDLAFAKKLRTAVTPNFEGDTKGSGFNQSHVEAIIRNLQAQIDSFTDKNKKDIGTLGTEWQDKILTGIEKIEREQELSINKLDKKAKEIYGNDFQTQAAYKEELAALDSYYADKIAAERQKEADRLAALKPGTQWQDELLSGVEKVMAEQAKAEKELSDNFKAYYGDKYAQEASYEAELAALRKNYDKEIAEAKKRDLDDWASAYEKYLDNLKYKQLEAMKNKDWKGTMSATAKTSALNAIQSTEVGQVAKGAAQGGPLGAIAAALNAFITAIINAIGQLENGGKVLNFISTIVNKMFEVIGPLVDAILKPAAVFLETLGTTLGKILQPLVAIAALLTQTEPILQIITSLLEMVGNLFQGIYDILKPIFQVLAEGYNFIVDLLGAIGIKLQKVSLNFGESAKVSEELIEEQKELIQKKFSRMTSAANELLQSQLDALKSQYELGLISREDYEKQAEKYAVETDKELLEINKMQAKVLGQIEKNTYASATGDKNGLSESRQSYAKDLSEKWGEKAGFIGKLAGGIVGGIGDVGKAVWNGVKAVGNGIVKAGQAVGGFFKKLFTWSWDVGTPDIPFDHLAMVHQGETIIPKTFAEGIRTGDLALVGGGSKNKNASASPIYVTVNVQGSVLSERQLVDAVYDGIAGGIKSNRLDPLPGAIA